MLVTKRRAESLHPAREEVPTILYQIDDEGKVILGLRVLNKLPQGDTKEGERKRPHNYPDDESNHS